MFHSVYIIPNPQKDEDFAITKKVAEVLNKSGIEIFLPDSASDGLPFNHVKNCPEIADLILVIGGDGSVLDASPTAIQNGIPLLGINLGKVGYLAKLEPERISHLPKILSGETAVSEKMLLQATLLHQNGDKEVSNRLAVNDCIVSHDIFLGMADFSLDCHGESLRQRADGLVLSTPTGSTAYSYSAGGPVIAEGVNAILATPICPHSFFDRSTLFSENDTVEVRNTGASPLAVSIDGRRISTMEPGAVLSVRKAKSVLKLLSVGKDSATQTLFRKLKIMEDLK